MSIWDKILGIFGFSQSPEKKKLRSVKKYLKSSKAGFIRIGSDTLEPNMAKFFYTLYQFSFSYLSIIERVRKSDSLFPIIFEECLTEKQKLRFISLSSEALENKLKEIPLDILKTQTADEYNLFISDMKAQDIRKINETYSVFKVFEELVTFNYYSILVLFDPAFPPNDFKYKPKFNSINGRKMIPFLKDFSEVLNVIAFVPHWESVFSTIRIYNRGVDPVKATVWQKIIKDLVNLKKSGLIESIIHYLEGNMDFRPNSALRVENLASKYLDGYKDNIQNFFYKVQQQQEAKEINRLMSYVFNQEELSRIATYKMKNYSEEASSKIYSKVSVGYRYSKAFLYLKAFLIESVKTQMRDVVNTLIVKGQWQVNQFSRDLSDQLYSCMNLTEDIKKFDDLLAETNTYGKRVFVLLHRQQKDKSSSDLLKQAVEDINSKALIILKKSYKELSGLKNLLDEVLKDFKRDNKTRELLMNGKELEGEVDVNLDLPFVEALEAADDRLSSFMEFLSLYVN